MDVMLQSLESLPLPTRMATVARRLDLHTVGDLARRHPSALLLEKNLGRSTIRETREVIERVIGMRWEDASMLDVSDDDDFDETPLSVSIDPASLGWDGLAILLPAQLKTRLVSASPLPPRLLSFAASRSLSTLGDLVAVKKRDLFAAPNLGPRTVKDATVALLKMREATSTQGIVLATDWKRLIVAAIAKLPLRERMVVTQRAGLVGPPPTLQELGESLGVSRERVRQLEFSVIAGLRTQLVWTAALGEVLLDMCPTFAVRLDLVQVDGAPLLASPEDDADAFRFLTEVLLEGRAGHVFDHDGVVYFGRATHSDFSEKLERVDRVARGLNYPIALAELPRRLGESAGLSSPEMLSLYEIVRDRCRREGDCVLGYGERQVDAVTAYLRKAGRPARVAEVSAACGRGNWPDDVVWLDRGLVTLPDLVPDFSVWRRRIGPLVAAVMSEYGDMRQWTTNELLSHLEPIADLPEWMNPHSLGSLLRGVSEVRYLGRNVVALPLSPAESREHVDEVMEGELLDASGPLDERELARRVRERRGVTDIAWNMTRVRAPFVLFEDGRIGLSPRDVPGGESTVARMKEEVARWLELRDEGAGVPDLRLFLGSLGAPLASWDIRLARSILRQDERFRLAQGGGLGLTVWGETRTKTQLQVLERLLAADGKVRVPDAVAALPTASGEPIARGRLGLLANRCGARLVGDLLVKREAEAGDESLGDFPESSRAYLERVPEKAVETFARYLKSSRSSEELSASLVEWQSEMLTAGVPTIDEEQVLRLSRLAKEALERADALRADRSPEAESRARAARAAVEYLVCVEDGESDWLVGGLDDDECVLSAVLCD